MSRRHRERTDASVLSKRILKLSHGEKLSNNELRTFESAPTTRVGRPNGGIKIRLIIQRFQGAFGKKTRNAL